MGQFHEILENRTRPLKASTMQNYRHITRLRLDGTPLASMPPKRVRRSDVYRWWDDVQRDHPKARMINQQAYKRLRAAYTEAVRRQMVEVNPVDVPDAGRRTVPKEKYLPSDEELEKILKYLPDRYKALGSKALHHGLRIGEALAVAVDEVVMKPGLVPYLPPMEIQVRRNA